MYVGRGGEDEESAAYRRMGFAGKLCEDALGRRILFAPYDIDVLH
jgi:hypothetical protein